MKKTCLFLATLLMLLSAATLFMCVPAVANEAPLDRSYKLYPAPFANYNPDARVLEPEWSTIESSEAFVSSEKGTMARPEDATFSASFKAAWAPIANDSENITIYFLLEVQDSTPVIDAGNTLKDGVAFAFTSGNSTVYREFIHLDEPSYTSCGGYWGGWKMSNNEKFTVGIHHVEGGYVAKINFTVKKSADFSFDFLIQDNFKDGSGLASCERFSWNGMTLGMADYMKGESLKKLAPSGTMEVLTSKDEIDEQADVLFMHDGVLVASLNKTAGNTVVLPDFTMFGNMVGWKDATGAMYPVGATFTVGSEQVTLTAVTMQPSDYEVLAGASVLIEDPTALRFEVKENTDVMNRMGTALTEKGAILVPTASLTDAVLADGAFDADELTAANIAFEKIAFTTAENGIHYVVKSNITDMSVSYSIVSYLTVQYADGSTVTYTTAYIAANHARSVKGVSELAYADRSSVRTEIDGVNYKFKVSKTYGVEGFMLFSYSPYTEEQLTLLGTLKK